jgi:alcohol dehydrogenase (cytochrome c)
VIRRFTLLSTLGVCGLLAQTAAQSNSGRRIYTSNCASCHLPDLSGQNEAPPLSGSNFINVWGSRSTTELLNYIRTSMPPGNAGSLPQETCADLVAFILEANGATPGSRLLSPRADIRIGTVAKGQMPAALRELLNKSDRDEAGLTQIQVRPKGLSVRGEVKNYVPVTDEMLLHPDPGDWLMIRRNYEAWSYSPLNQIRAGQMVLLSAIC